MCTLVLVLPSWIIDGLLDVLNGSIICSESVYCPLSKYAKESISSAGGHLFASYINWEAWWKFDITWNCQFQLWVFMVYSSYPLSIVLKSFQGNYWLFYNQWYTSFVESFLFRQARWKIIQTQQIYQNIFQWSATTSLFLWSMCLQLAEGFSSVYTTVTALAASLLCSGLLGK